jgi:two-component system cell cycle response regulator
MSAIPPIPIHPSAGAPGHGSVARVILAGRTGVDTLLRREPGVEVVRARGGLEAIAELALADAPVHAVVVGPDAPASPDDEQRLVAVLRRLDPGVRLLRTGACDGLASLYDALIPADATRDQVRARVFGSPSAEPAPGAPAIGPDAPPDTEPAPLLPPGDAGVGDESLAARLLAGEDVLPSALDALRARLGRPDLRYVPRRQFPSGQPPPGARVTWKGEILGVLAFEGTPPPALDRHAAWLAAWAVLEDQHAQLRHAAFTDPLTGAWNRRYFDRFLSVAIDEARRLRRNVSILMFDIDDFKVFNDRQGHARGDEILAQTVRLLRSVIRPTDRVCRIGGDEFAVIFYDPHKRGPVGEHPQSVFDMARRFQEQICRHRFPKLGSEAPETLTVSGGLATFPWDGATPADLLRRADELALQSKRLGKNVITLGPGAERLRDG